MFKGMPVCQHKEIPHNSADGMGQIKWLFLVVKIILRNTLNLIYILWQFLKVKINYSNIIN